MGQVQLKGGWCGAGAGKRWMVWGVQVKGGWFGAGAGKRWMVWGGCR